MDITSFVVDGRDKALLYGDYSTYHASLAKRLLNSRKKIGIATRNRGKYSKKEQVTAENVAENHEYVYLLLLTSERAWAQAMSIKTGHAADQKGITGRTRSHIISRLDKAARTAESLAEILSDSSAGASSTDVLEAKAYAAMIRGAMQFEKQTWEPCLGSYATARVVYSALASAVKGDIFKDLLSETIDPSIRYAAYQLKTPRTVPIPVIARKKFPESDTALTEQVNKLDPRILRQGDAASQKDAIEGEEGPKTLTWRSREVKIEDAQIASAWASVLQAKTKLGDKIEKEGEELAPHEIANAYEEVLMSTQDAVDATKQAIDELRGEGVGQGDARMQSLQITRTAVNYEMISWRVGRNRVLTGPNDGAPEVYASRGRRKKKGTEEPEARAERDPPQSRKLAKLKEKAALYDGTLQNLDSIKELPGVANDEDLATRLDVYSDYFESLKCLAIARSHAIIGNVTNALALISHCLQLSQSALSNLSDSAPSATSGPLNIDVPRSSLEFLSSLLNGELQRHRAIVHIDNLRKKDLAASASDPTRRVPLADRLHEYPAEGVDLKNVIQFPPKMGLIPMKPIFLDVAWDYIDYDSKTQGGKAAAAKAPAPVAAKEEQADKKQPPAKKGWFGFGR